MLNLKAWHQDLREKRESYGVTQNKLAVMVEVSREYINKIESVKKNPSDELMEKIEFELEKCNPECPLEMVFDYVRIRFPTTNVEQIIKKILRLKIDHLLHADFGFYSYPEHFRFGDVTIMFSREDETKGVLLELKGKGCRQFENFLLAQKRSWYQFFQDCLDEEALFKRIDLAINDKTGILNIPELSSKCEKEECVSIFRSFKDYRSGELVQKNEKLGMGHTLYIGSLKSEVYFCLYEKDFEQYVKLGVPIEEAEVKNRFEIRLKNDRATHAIHDLLKYKDAEKTSFEIINRYVRFVDKNEERPRSKWEMNENWAWFIGKYRSQLKLTTKPEPYTFERTLKWLQRQVAPTLKIAKTLDILKGTEVLENLIQEARLMEHHEKLLEQQLLEVGDVIL